MDAPKSLRRPANWQDFETLCKKLWGEIWSCPEIKKNGRAGQDQHGVDVYGVPQGESRYFGIQCKGKDEYTHKQFTEVEIDAEINKAKLFSPSLKKFYLATTAVKDTKVEEYVRQKNLENIEKNLFEVHIFSWEDIVELIDENQQTHDWYVKSQNFKTKKSCKLTFHDDSTELVGKVIFQQEVSQYTYIDPESKAKDVLLPQWYFEKPKPLFDNRINLSFFKFNLKLHNTGSAPIEEYKVELKFDGNWQALETVSKWKMFSKHQYTYNVFINGNKGQIRPEKSIIVGEEAVSFDKIQIKPFHESSTVFIHWKLISTDYKDEGTLTLYLTHEVKRVINQIPTFSSQKDGLIKEEKEIKDYFEGS